MNTQVNGKQLTEKQYRAYRMLDVKTRDQRNEYMGKVVKYETRQLQAVIDDAERNPNGRYAYMADYAKTKLSLLNIYSLEWMNTANEYFNTKLMVMVQKLEGFGFLESNVWMNTDTMHVDADGSLDFWIEGIEKETGATLGRVHARLVPVDGYEKCFHYRFICTLKGAPAKKQEVKVESTEVPPVCGAEGTTKEKVAKLMDLGYKAQQIADQLNKNVSYIRTVMRGLR